MKKILENVARLTTHTEYELLSLHLENLIREATDGGFLADPCENDYTREIARLSVLGAQYADEFLTFSFSPPKSPLVLSVQHRMTERGMKQKEAAKYLGVNEPALSRFLSGRNKISYDIAKRLYTKFRIDADLIFSE